ncbi:MAG: molybdopterin-dependent oxidoreductase, partial [Actinobacteria bacterium]|nr:molybdopterin-dependent oxidoreductase [Actinomycetota bacterium]
DLVEVSWSDALTKAASALGGAKERHGSSSIAVVGGARLTNEEAYAWSKLARSVLGTDSVDAQMGDGLPSDVVLGLPRATIDETCAAGTVVLLGPDLKEELPILYLRLRDAVVNHGLNVIEISASQTSMTRYAAVSLRYRPGEAAVLVQELFEHAGDVDVQADLGRARALLEANNVVCVLGRPSVAERADSVVQAALRLRSRVPGMRFLSALRRANIHGALDMGLSPGMLPGRVSLEEGREVFTEAWGQLPGSVGLDTAGVLRAAAEGRIQALILVGADPLADFPDRDLARRGVAGAGFVLAVDCFATDSVRQADVVLPAVSYAEKAGTTTNIEGRVSRLHQKVTAPGTTRPDWMIACDLAERLGGDLGFETAEAIWDEIERLAPAHSGLTAQRLASSEGLEGIVAAGPSSILETTMDVTATATLPVDGYSLRLVSTRKLYDNGTLVQQSPSLAPLAPGEVVRANPADLDRLGVASNDRVRVASSRGAVVAPVEADAAVARGTVLLAFNQSGSGAADLIDVSLPVTEVRVETVGIGDREVSG